MKQTVTENQTKLGFLPYGATFKVPGEDQVYEVVSFPGNSAYPLLGKRHCMKKGMKETGDLKGKSFDGNTQVIRIPEISEHSEKS